MMIHVIYLLRNVCYLAMGLTEAVAFISYIKGAGINGAFMSREEPAPTPVQPASQTTTQSSASVCPKCGRKEGEGVPMEKLNGDDYCCCK